ncbi:hypothetical protein EC968_003409 [Mortierella alpina]|nr:hypothetical protein EC968_003409 [Mortierella alpina]
MSTQKPLSSSSSSTSTSSSPTSPLNVNVNVNVSFKHSANEAFYSEPSFEEKKRPSLLPSPTSETAMLDINPAPDTPASAAAPAAIAATATTATAPQPSESPVEPKQPSATAGTPAAATAATAPAATATAPATTTAAAVNTAPAPAPAVVSVTPALAPVSPTAPAITPVLPTVALSISTTEDIIMDEGDSDSANTDLAAEANDAAVAPASTTGSATKEQHPQPTDVDERGIQRKQIEELMMLNAQLQTHLEDTLNEKQSVDDELNRTRGAYHDLNRHFMDIQQKLAKRESDYEVMSKNYLEHVRLIRPTDDDHSTIMDRLTQLKASIEHLIRKAQGGRSVNLQKDVAIEHLKAKGLLEGFPVPEDKLESFHLNLFMESVVMSTLVSHFFDKALCCVFDYNKGFKEIYDWMFSRNEKMAVRFRQQLCVMVTQDPDTKVRQEEQVNTTAAALSELLSSVYANTNELAKIRDLCNKAFELAIAMTGLESVISPVTIPLGTPFDEDNMGTSLKSNPEGKVALVIFPAFRDKECAFDVRPKVWCH